MSTGQKDCDSWLGVAAACRETMRQKAEAFQNHLKENPPILYLPTNDEDLPHIGVGYWRMDGHVLTYRKLANGKWDPFSAQEYSDQDIQILSQLIRS